MMGIKKLGDGKFEIRVKHSGSEIRRTLRGTRADAVQVHAQIKSSIAEAKAAGQIWDGITKLKGKPKTFEDVAALYLQSMTTDKIKTIDVYDSLLKHHILPALGTTPVRSIDQACVEKFRASLINKPAKGKRSHGKMISSATINTVLALTSAILTFAERTSMIDKAPHLKRLPQERIDIDPLSIDEFQTVLDAASEFWRPVFQLLGTTGLRIGELCALTWSDVDLVKNEIRVTKQLSKNVIVKPKTASSVRNVKILPAARAALIEFKNRDVANINGLVIVSLVGENLSPTNTYEAWVKTLKNANVRRRPLHQLRHTYASILIQSGVKPGWVAGQLGHSNMSITFKHYSRYLPSNDSIDLTAAKNAMADLTKIHPEIVKREL